MSAPPFLKIERRPSIIIVALAALTACGEPLDADPASACPLDLPVRLIAGPASKEVAPGRRFAFESVGQRLLYRFEASDDPALQHWLLGRCGGEPELLDAPIGAYSFQHIETADGTVLYANTAAGPVLVDRLDVPGSDLPAPITGLPPESLRATRTDYGLYIATVRVIFFPDPQEGAAAIGAPAEAVFMHHGDPAAAAVPIGDAVIQIYRHGDDLIVHDDDGALRRVDPRTGASAPLLSGVRHFRLAGDRWLIWQALGDDHVEPVYRRDLDTGDDLEIAVNDFTARSWDRPGDPQTRSTGTWRITSDDRFAAQFGPDHRLAAVVRLDTGAALTGPEGARLVGSLQESFELELEDRDELVLALWDPSTDDLRVWYRGPPTGARPAVFARDGDLLDYSLPDLLRSVTGSLWRVDLATGQTALRIPRIGPHTVPLADGRYFTALPTSSTHYPIDLVVFDPDDQRYTTIAAAVDDLEYVGDTPDSGLFYLDSRGPKPGLWAAPLPAKQAAKTPP